MASAKSFILAAAAVLLLCAAQAQAAPFSRIISLYPGHTDNIISLGGAQRLIAVSENEDDAALPQLPRLTLKTGAEAIIALKPDLVLMRDLVLKQNPNLPSVLGRAGIKVIVLNTPSWDEFESYLRTLSALIGANPDEASAKLAKQKKLLAMSAAKYKNRKKPTVLVEATSKELHTCAPDSWAARLIELCGGVNAAAGAKPIRHGSAIAPWGLERTLKSAGSGLDIYLVQNGPMNVSTRSDLAKRPWYSALKKSKLAVMPERYLSRASLSSLEKGGQDLIKIFYGE